jgi:peptide/nickel transport system substrate-binding protein
MRAENSEAMTDPTEPRLNQPLSRREALRAAGIALVAGGGAFALAGCGASVGPDAATAAAPAASGTKRKRGGSIQVAVGDASTSENLDPQRPWNENNLFYVGLAYQTLLVLDAGFNLRPVLATSWSSDKDAREWTFHIRKGVKFHDGSPLTAHDVVWSIRRLYQPSLANPYAGPLSRCLKPSDVTAVDDHTVVAKLIRPNAFLPVIFAYTGTEIIRKGQNSFPLKEAIGTGPFKFKTFEAGQGWSVVRNEHYWEPGLPYLDEIRGVSTPDPTALVEAVTSGSADLSTSIAFSEVPVVKQSGSADVLSCPARFDAYIVMDARHKPFDDVRVRQAIKLADKRREILSSAYLGDGVLTSDAPVPSTDQFYPPALGIRTQNIAKAKQLLREAGYPNGLDLTLYTGDVLGGMVDMATAFAQAVAPAGIRVSVKQHPASTYFEQVWLVKPFYTTWLSRGHPAVRIPMTLASYSSWAETHVPHTKVDSLLAAAEATTDPEQQRQRMQTLIQWIADNDGYINAAFPDRALAAKKNLNGIEFPQINGPSLTRAWLS